MNHIYVYSIQTYEKQIHMTIIAIVTHEVCDVAYGNIT
jgi:hypothetical protein